MKRAAPGRYPPRMRWRKFAPAPGVLVFVMSSAAPGQVAVTSDQLGFGAGHKRSFLTHAGPEVDVSGRIGGEGGPQHWDFTTGPVDNRYRQEVIDPASSGVDGGFPEAMLAEESVFQSNGEPSWSFYNLTEDGRELHGFYRMAAFTSPTTAFEPPFVDFPATMRLGDRWNVEASYDSEISVVGQGTFDVANEVAAALEIDAFGTLALPGFGEVEVIRLEEFSTTTSVADVAGTPVPVGTVFVRSYYWLSPQFGIVAQISSPAATEEPAEAFASGRFLRLESFTAPVPETVVDLRVARSGPALVLTWGATGDPEGFAVETSADLSEGSWRHRATVSERQYIDIIGDGDLYYRVSPR